MAKQILRKRPLASQLSSVDIKENLDEVIDAVKAWLSFSNNTRWLMIYDNYDNPKLPGNADPAAVDIRKFVPESYQGSVIITTRSSQVKVGHLVRIRKLGNNVRPCVERRTVWRDAFTVSTSEIPPSQAYKEIVNMQLFYCHISSRKLVFKEN